MVEYLFNTGIIFALLFQLNYVLQNVDISNILLVECN